MNQKANFTTETQRTPRLKSRGNIRRLHRLRDLFPAVTGHLKRSCVRAQSVISSARPTTDRNLCNLRILPAFFLRLLCLFAAINPCLRVFVVKSDLSELCVSVVK